MASLLASLRGGFARLAHDLMTGTAKLTQLVDGVEKEAPTITNAVHSAISAQTMVSQVGAGLLGKVVETVTDFEAVVAAGGINIPLDAREIEDLKAVWSYLKGHPSAPATTPGVK